MKIMKIGSWCQKCNGFFVFDKLCINLWYDIRKIAYVNKFKVSSKSDGEITQIIIIAPYVH